MQKHYCSYELSMLAKNAGFDEKCKAIYYNERLTERANSYQNSTIAEKIHLDKKSITAPELTVLQQWCYEKFGVWINVLSNFGFTEPNLINKKQYFYMTHIDLRFDCPYKALGAGLLEFLKSKTQ